MTSQSEENYLKVLYALTNHGQPVSLSELSQELNITPSSANSMIRKLHGKGYVKYTKHQPLSLTPAGLKEAASIVRKHRLAEMYLVDKMGFGWEQVHEIAEQIEHINSPILFERMDELLGHPTIDPHGSPIPDKNGKTKKQPYKRLSQSKAGDKIKIVALEHSSVEFLEYLNNKKLTLGTTATVKELESFDGSMTIVSNNRTLILSSEACERLMIENL